jgi:pyrroloquinoline-quinone synthase
MDRISQLDAIVAQFDLNRHPFYQDWAMGTLPVEKLRLYAAEYARFVDTIDEGWDTVGQSHYAEEERVHEALWADFRREIGGASESALAGTDTLATAARNLYAERATAYGALYAFEAQQPNTSRSKLDGLNAHYAVSDKAKEYFRVHADDFAEAECLREAIRGLSDAEFEQTKTACAIVCAAMWGALDAIYYARETVTA